MKTVIFFSFIFSVFFISNASSNLELLIRADQFTPYKLPSLTKMPNMTPSCGESNRFAVEYWHVQEEVKTIVKLFNGRDFVESKLFGGGLIVGDTFLTSEGVMFPVNRRGESKGAFFLNNEGVQTQIVNPDDYEKLIAVSRPALLNGTALFRGLHSNGLRTVYLGKKEILKESESSPFSYIFLPSVRGKELVVKVNYGEPGNVKPENPDEILLYKNNKFISVVKDTDLDSTSDFISFDNSPVPDGKGGVVFIADHRTYGRSLWHYNKSELELIYNEEEGLGKLEYFKPATGENRIVFRTLLDKRRKLVSWGEEKFTVILSQGDTVISNEKDLRVIDRDKWPAFSGAPCVSDSGEVLLHTVLESSVTKENKGSAVFRVKTSSQ